MALKICLAAEIPVTRFVITSEWFEMLPIYMAPIILLVSEQVRGNVLDPWHTSCQTGGGMYVCSLAQNMVDFQARGTVVISNAH